MADRLPFELVKDAGDSPNTVFDIDTCIYGMEHYPKGYAKISQMAEMPDGGEWNADWHPQGDYRMGPTDSDFGPGEINGYEATSRDLERDKEPKPRG